jgi:pheromone shutdown protein TraB
MSAQLTKKLGMAPGGEFRAAVREARTIPGCLLLLGDRPFKVTLSRALAALSFGQKLKLAWQFLTSNDDITKDEIERCKEKDLLERMMMEMTGEFPAISRVFVSERDTYLAHSLWLAATSTSHKNQGGPIVGVVGMGHVSGIVQNWGNTTEEQIANLMIIPEPSVTSIIVRATVKYSFYALLGYGVYKLSRRLFDFPSNGIVQSAWDRMPQITTKSIGISR